MFDPSVFGVPAYTGGGAGDQSSLLNWLGKNVNLQSGAGLLTALMGLGGLAGGIQTLAQGAPKQTQTTTAARTPEEQQALLDALSRSSQQNSLMDSLAAMLMGGNLPPGVNRMITESFQNALGDIVEGSIEGARQRGFAGGADLLQGAAGPTYARLASQMPGQMAQTRLNALTGIPQAAQGLGQTQNQNISLLAQLARPNNQTTTMQGPQPGIAQAMQPIAQGLGAMGQGLYGMSLFNKSLSGT